VAGTTGYDYATMLLPESAAEQARNAWATIGKILREGGFALEDIVRATYYVTSRNDARAVLDVCGAVLAGIRPAATVLIVAGLIEPEMKVEIEVTALRNHS